MEPMANRRRENGWIAVIWFVVVHNSRSFVGWGGSIGSESL